MATFTGPWAPSSGTNRRMRLRAEISIPTPRAGQTSVTVTGRVHLDAGWSFYDSSNNFSWSGTLLGSGSTSKNISVGTNGSQQLHSFSKTVTLTSSSQRFGFAFSLGGVNYVGATATLSGIITVAARALQAPAAPTGLTVTRVSNQRQTLRWKASPTSTAPIDTFQVERWTSVSRRWHRVTSFVPGTARSYAAGGTGIDQRVQYRVRARNQIGMSGWATSAAFHTAPKPPTSVRATMTGLGSATIRWVNNSTIAESLIVQESSRLPGGTWSGWTAVATGVTPSATSRARSGLDTSREYRWRVVSAASPDQYGFSTPSNTITPAKPPAAPTLLAPGAIVEAGPTMFRWRHRSLDGSSQTGWDIEVVPAEGATLRQDGTTSQQFSFDLEPGEHQWRARTRGAHASFGPWSAWTDFEAVTRPSVEILSPEDGSVSQASRGVVEWSYADDFGAQASWVAALLDEAGATVEELSGEGEDTRAEFSALLFDESTYTIRVEATSGTGLSGDASTTFTTKFIPPPAPILDVSWDEERGEATLAVTNPPIPEGRDDMQPPVDNRLERSLDDGETWETVADGVELDGSATDWTAPLHATVWYRAIATTEPGTEAVGEPVSLTTNGEPMVMLHTENGELLRLVYNMGISVDAGHELTLQRYEGRAYPTAHFGEGRGFSIKLDGVLLAEDGTYTDGIELLGQLAHYRDPEGRAVWVTVTEAGLSSQQSQHEIRAVSLSLEGVDHG